MQLLPTGNRLKLLRPAFTSVATQVVIATTGPLVPGSQGTGEQAPNCCSAKSCMVSWDEISRQEFNQLIKLNYEPFL